MRNRKEIEDTGHIPQSRMDIDYRLLPHAYGEGMLESPETSTKAPIPPIAQARKRSRQRDTELYYEMLEGPLTPEEVLILQEFRKNLTDAFLSGKGIKIESGEEPTDEELKSILDEVKEEWEDHGAEEEWEPHELLEVETDRKLENERLKRGALQAFGPVRHEITPGDRQLKRKQESKEKKQRVILRQNKAA